jgi:filamentous hemagglutinin family protein
MRLAFLWALLLTLVLCLISPSGGDAQLTTNISSSGLNTQISQVGNSYNITGGTRPGGGPNLFHSFGDFTVGAGNIANFLNNTGLPTSNILGRVTAGNISNIYGTIQTTGFSTANLFLMNPSGFVFGPNASLNVGGSVSFTTAQYIRLFDGLNSANFYANPANDALSNSILKIDSSAFAFLNATPAAYGFLNAPDPNATITVQGSALSVPSGQSISLVGGSISIQAGTLDNGTVQAATLSTPGGRINLASVASAGEVLYPSLQFGPNVTGGSIALSQGSTLDVSGSGNIGSGVVFLRGGQLVIDQSSVIANTVDGNAANPGIDIQVSQEFSLTNGAVISSSTSGAGRGADVAVVAGTVQMDGALITSATTGTGRGGNISITDTPTVNLTNGAQIVSSSNGLSAGGDITVSATDAVSISGSDATGTLSGIINPFVGVVTSGIFSTASAGGSGGQIIITAPVIAVDNLGTIGTFNNGGGLQNQKGGDVVLNGGTISFTNGASILSLAGVNINTGNTEGSGNGGNVTIRGVPGAENDAAQSVTVSGGQIFSATFGPGRGGDVLVTSGAVELNTGSSITSAAQDGVGAFPGAGGNITLNLNTLTLKDFSSILSTAATFPSEGAFGTGGNVLVQGLHGAGSASQLIQLSSNSSLGSQTFGTAAGGRVTLSSESVVLDGGSSLFATTAWTGLGGDIELNVQDISISASTVNSSTALPAPDAGAGGKITVQGLGGNGTSAALVSLSGKGSIESSSSGTGRLGDIEIHAKVLNLTEGASIQAGTQQDSAAVAGNVTIEADTIDMSGESRIASQVFAANAGQVSIAANQMALDNSSIETSTTGVGRAGDVVMKVGTISLTDSHISSASTGTEAVIDFANGTTIPPGSAGNITITATGSFTSNASTVKTSAEANHGGDISITAQNVQLSNHTSINASSNAPLQVTRLVLDGNGQLVEQVVGDGNAGNITINSASNFTMQDSFMTTSAAHASGGQISVNAPNTVQLVNSNIVTSVQGSSGDTAGGDISIDPQFVILQGSQILAQANAGTGGNISIVSNVFLADPYSLVDATSQLGVSGVIDIRSPVSNISGVVGRLPESVLAAQALLRAACAARLAESKVSSFVERGRDHIPVGPEGLLATPYVATASEPLAQMSSARASLRETSGFQVRRLIGQDLIPGFYLLSGDAACQS